MTAQYQLPGGDGPMSVRADMLRRLAMSFGAYDEARDSALIDAYRAEVLREAADAVANLPQDFEKDPGRRDVHALLLRMAEGDDR